MAPAHPVKIHQVDRRPRREQVQQDGEEFAEFLHEVLGRGERDTARGHGRYHQGEHAFPKCEAARLQGIGNAQQRQGRTIEIERRDREQSKQRAQQQRLAEPRDHRIRSGTHRGGKLHFRMQGGRHGADQHGPRAADERAQIGPPERGADPHVAGQIAGIIGYVNGPRDLIRGGRKQLRQKRHGAKIAPRELFGRQRRLRKHRHREHQQRDDQHIRDPTLREMNQVIAGYCEGDGQQREYQHCRRGWHAIQGMQGLRGEDLIESIESNVGKEGHAPYQQCAHVAELRPRLNHLRQSELRALRRMKRHEERAQGRAENHRDRHPHEIAAERDADDPGGHRREMRIARKPHRPKMPHLAVTFGDRHVVNRSLLDQSAAELCLHLP